MNLKKNIIISTALAAIALSAGLAYAATTTTTTRNESCSNSE